MRLVAAAFAASLVVAGCGDDGGDEPIPQSGERETTTTEATTTTSTPATTEVAEDGEDAAAADALQIVVTNDDGIAAEGIDALVTALAEVDGIDVTVVAPAAQQSGTGGSVTEGALVASPGETASGYEATAVEGFPADTIRVAFENLALQPDLVISGINEGQNLGGIVEISGTVGAARAALRLGVPALAVSQGAGAGLDDYEIAAGLVVDWLEENRDAIAAGEMPTDAVVNINVPTCPEGKLRGTLEVSTSTSTEGAVGVAADCTASGDGYADDISAFLNGYAAVAEVSVEPAV